MEVNLGMIAHFSQQLRRPVWAAAILALSCFVALPRVFAQTNISDTYKVSDAMKAKLVKTGDLTLRDANFVEALFGIRRAWGVNIVVPNDGTKETINCEFVDAPLFEVLDTILGPRGYGYKPVGNSLVVMKQDAFGPLKPLFQTATITIRNADPDEVKEAVSVYLSEHGQVLAIPSARRLNVIDFPDRLEMIELKAKELDDAAKEIIDEDQAAAQQALTGQQNPGGIVPGRGGPAAMLPAAPPTAAYFKLNFLKAESVGPQLITLLNPTGRLSVFAKDNRLLVVDTADRLKLVAQAIEQLDVPRPQVRIDALIYDASLEDARRCGVNWGGTLKGNNLDAAGVAQDSIALQAITAANPAAGLANGALTFTSLGSNFDLRTVINALAQSKDSRLLSDPSVIVYDQETATFEAVTEIPYQQLTQGLGGGSIGTTAFREAGTTLTVTPQISGDQTIRMDINPRFSILAGLTPETNQPIIDRRETRTVIRVQNGGTIVIGGLRQRSAIKNMSKVPYLGDIKHIGHLFRDKQATVRESELIVFITPTVIDMGYVGTPRQVCNYNSALPELDTIPYPKLPDYPCPTDQWPHRCGLCDKCKKYHNGECNGPMPGEYGDPGYEQLPPPSASEVQENAPTQSPVPVPEPPPVKTASHRKSRSQPVAGATRVSPFKTPIASKPAAAKETIPPLMTDSTVLYVPLERIPNENLKTSRLPAAATAEYRPVQPTTVRPVNLNIREMRRLPSVESEAGAAPATPEPPPVTKTSGPKRLSPARPVHLAPQPIGTGLR
ncbi:MAG: type II secretion system protein GspD [Pirellulaceae bacterium]